MGHHQPVTPLDNYGLPAPPAPSTQTVPITYEAICPGCDTVERRPDRMLPADWSTIPDERNGNFYCPACLRSAKHRAAIEAAGVGPILIIDANGWSWIHEKDVDETVSWFVHPRVKLTSFPAHEAGSVVVLLTSPAEPGIEPDGIMLNLSRVQLGGLIADLQAIERELTK